MKNSNTISLSLFACLAVFLSGCFSLKPEADPSRYYVLSNGESGLKPNGEDCPKRLLIGPVRVAGHLDRKEIAQRVGSSEIRYFNWVFWAEPLSRALPREFLSMMNDAVDEYCVFDFRTASLDEDTLQLEIEFDQFEMTDEGNVVVSAHWNLMTFDGVGTRRLGSARIVEPIGESEDQFTASIKALRVSLNQLTDRIVENLD